MTRKMIAPDQSVQCERHSLSCPRVSRTSEVEVVFACQLRHGSLELRILTDADTDIEQDCQCQSHFEDDLCRYSHKLKDQR